MLGGRGPRLSEDEEPGLLVKADDGLTQGLYEILKPVQPTKTAYLEAAGRPRYVDGRLVEAAKTAAEEAEDLFEVGERVYLQNLTSVR